MTPHDPNPDPAAPPARVPGGRKPYRAPRLESYGNVREITRALVQTGNKNDHSGGPNKT